MTITLHDVVAQKKGIYDRQKKVHCGQKKITRPKCLNRIPKNFFAVHDISDVVFFQ